MRLFADANVLFSASHSTGGRASALFLLARKRHCEIVVSPHAIEEARRNLEIKYPQAIPRLGELLREVTRCSECPPDTAAWARAQSLPDKDAPILGAAVHCHADVLVTGDHRHFGHLYGKSPGGVLIVTPAEALRLLMETENP